MLWEEEKEEDDVDYEEEILENLEEIEELVGAEQEEIVDETRSLFKKYRGAVFGKVISGFDLRDVGESFLGSLLFGFPMVVEGGTVEVGTYTSQNPFYFLITIFLTILVVLNVLYFIDLHNVKITNPILGFIPRRVVGVLLISFTTSLMLMTIWGRLDWNEPWLALNQATIAWSVMAIGASLGDILPGT